MRALRRWIILALAVTISVVSVIYQLSTGMDACVLDKQISSQSEEQQIEEKSDKYVKVINDDEEDVAPSQAESNK